MSSLKELQESFQRGILAGDDTILAEIKDSAKEERKTLFGVYRHAYVARLAEVLADDYEQLHAYLGDAGFAKFAKSYIAAHPSDRKSARNFGRHVPEFLTSDTGFAKHPELAEIARLEKALADAFDGPDAETLKLARLAEIAPELWTKLVFVPHPTAHPPQFRDQRRRHLVCVARGDRPAASARLARAASHPRLAPGCDGALPAARPGGSDDVGRGRAGTRFGVLCEMVATYGGEDGADFRAATYLKDWVDMESLADCRLSS